MLLGGHLDRLSKGYWGQSRLQSWVSLEAFKSAARCRGLKVSIRRSSRELRGQSRMQFLYVRLGRKVSQGRRDD